MLLRAFVVLEAQVRPGCCGKGHTVIVTRNGICAGSAALLATAPSGAKKIDVSILHGPRPYMQVTQSIHISNRDGITRYLEFYNY